MGPPRLNHQGMLALLNDLVDKRRVVCAKESIVARKVPCQLLTCNLRCSLRPDAGHNGESLTCSTAGANLDATAFTKPNRVDPHQQQHQPMANAQIIEVKDLTKRYGLLVAVNRVSFSVQRGEVFGLLGPNGAGKTTTVEILEGMRAPDSGTATVNGVDVTQDPQAVKSMIGVQLQTSAFFDDLSLSEMLSVFGSLYREKVDPRAILDTVEMGEKAKAQYKELSGGQKQRFSIAVGLVNDPVLLFLDEPTTGLDPQARRNMWELVSQLKEQGKTIVLTTHYMEEAETLCDRVAIMDKGMIIALDSPGGLVDQLLDRGFHRPQATRLATLEDVFLDLTGKQLREA